MLHYLLRCLAELNSVVYITNTFTAPLVYHNSLVGRSGRASLCPVVLSFPLFPENRGETYLCRMSCYRQRRSAVGG
jgi:hypothetical protein